MKKEKKYQTLGEIYEKTIEGDEQALIDILQVVKCIVNDYLSFFVMIDKEKEVFLRDINNFVVNFVLNIRNNREKFVPFSEFMNVLSEEIVEEAKQLEMIGTIKRVNRK